MAGCVLNTSQHDSPPGRLDDKSTKVAAFLSTMQLDMNEYVNTTTHPAGEADLLI